MAVGAAGLAGEPVDDVGGVEDLDPGLRDGFALFLAHGGGDGVCALAQQGGGLAHQDRALIGGGVAPDLEAALGGGQRQIEVGGGGVRHLAEGFIGRGVGDRDGFAGQRIAPLAINIQLSIRIHGCLLLTGDQAAVIRDDADLNRTGNNYPTRN